MSEQLARQNQQGQALPDNVRDGGNYLFPTERTLNLGNGIVARVAIVQISPNERDGDVYYSSAYMGKEEVALTKNGLNKLARAAGVLWVTQECKIVEKTRDTVTYQAVCAVRDQGGNWLKYKGMKEIDLSDGGAEHARIVKQARSNEKLRTEQDRQNYIEREMLRAREQRLSMCETKAMNRALRALLQIKSKYQKQDLAKPFLVPHIDFRPDMSDPATANRYIALKAVESAALFGGAVPAALPEFSSGGTHHHGPPTGDEDDTITGEVVDVVDTDEEEDPEPGGLWDAPREREEPPAAPAEDPSEAWTRNTLKALIDVEDKKALSALSKEIRAKQADLSKDQVSRLTGAYDAAATRLQKGGK